MQFFLGGLIARIRSSRALFVLTLLGVALGVASVLSIQILNRSALGAFQGSVRAVGGEADLTVSPRGPFLPEECFPRILGQSGVASAWPVIRSQVALQGKEPIFLELVGLDLFAPRRIPWKSPPREFSQALSVPGWVAVTPTLAERMGWTVGQGFAVTLGSRRLRLQVGALVDFQKLAPLASSRLVVLDIAQAQTLLARPGEIDQVEIRLKPGANAAKTADRIRAAVGELAKVETPEERRDQAQELLGAFRLNLTALSLISLFVGAFLVYSSTLASLVRRRAEFGLMRSLGAMRGQVFRIIVGEVLLLGGLGVALGIPLGYAAARANMGSVSATLSNLYLLEEVESLKVSPATLALAALLGIGGALLGALAPAIEMSRKDHRTLLTGSTLRPVAGTTARPIFLAGVLLLGGVALWYAGPGHRWKPGGFILGIAVLLALPLIAPVVLGSGTGRLRVQSFSFAYGARSLSRSLGITSVAVAALAVAVCMLVGITVMIGSFRRTLELWIGSTIRADVYVSSESWSRSRGQAGLDPQTLETLATRDEVRSMDRLRQTFTECGGRRVSVIGVDMGLSGGESRFVLMEGRPREALRRARESGAILVGEPLARKGGWKVGDRLPIRTPFGEESLTISGIYFDYGSVQGSVAMDLAKFEKMFGQGPINTVALYMKPGADSERLVDQLLTALPDRGLQIRSNRALRDRILSIFEETFAVTRLLQAMSLIIAACGITLTLLVLAQERISELALYRALGASRPQIFRVFLGKGMALAVFGIGMGSAGGLVLALILVYGINRAYFGWTLALHFPTLALAGEALLLFSAAMLASLYPAVRASRTPATELSRDDL
ncbi:MAG: ABC transporter permease [Acidobacteria bacterium]|nr:ABC transporter permease [Acidobacteriota bacterium]